MIRAVIVFMFTSLNVLSQNVDFEGRVVDARTNAPIPYVNISFLNTLVGTSTDESGFFALEIPKKLLSNKVHVSSLGYKDTIVLSKMLFHDKLLSLKEDTYELEEVVVAEKLGNTKVLNPILSRSVTGGFDSSSTPWVLALYFPNMGVEEKYIEKVSVFFRDKNEFTCDSARFRLRFYGVDPVSKAPKTDLVKQSILMESVKGEDFSSIDVTDFKVRIPKEGIYVGLEWLFIPFNWYKKNDTDNITNKPKIEDRFAPTFGGIYTEDENLKVMVYGMGAWQEFKVKSKNNDKNFVPAVSLKIKERL